MATANSPYEIVNMAESLKTQCAEFNTKRFTYCIYVVDTRFGEQFTLVVPKTSNKDCEDTICEMFSSQLDSYVNNPSIAAVKVEFRAGNGVMLATREIWLRKKEYSSAPIIVQSPQDNHSFEEKREPQSQPINQQPTQQQSDIYSVKAIEGFATLLGLDIPQGLDGASPISGLGAILSLRDQRITEKFEQQRKQERYEELVVEKARLEAKLEQNEKDFIQLQREKQKQSEEIEDLTDEIEDLKEQIERLDPTKTLLGMSISSLGSNILLNGVKKLSKPISALAGVDEQVLLNLLDNTDTIEAVPPEQPQIEESAREQYIKATGQFIEALTDEQFAKFWKILEIIAADRNKISDIYEWLTLSNNTEIEEE